MLLSLFCLYLYPAFVSFKLASRKTVSTEELSRWLRYWSVLAVIIVFDCAYEDWRSTWQVFVLKEIACPENLRSIHSRRHEIKPEPVRMIVIEAFPSYFTLPISIAQTLVVLLLVIPQVCPHSY